MENRNVLLSVLSDDSLSVGSVLASFWYSKLKINGNDVKFYLFKKCRCEEGQDWDIANLIKMR